MSTLNYNAALLQLGLVHGYVSVPEAVEWADAEIAAVEHPHPVLIEVSTGGQRSPADLATELAPLAAAYEDKEIIDRVLGLMYRALSRDPG